MGAGIDANDRVYVITRMDARVIVYEPDGTFVTAWGEGIFTPRTHCIKFGPDGSVYTADDGNHTIRKFSPEGELLMTLGTPGVASDTGYDPQGGIQLRQARQHHPRWPPLQPPHRRGPRPQRGDLRLRRLRQRPGPPLHLRRQADPVLGGAGHRPGRVQPAP